MGKKAEALKVKFATDKARDDARHANEITALKAQYAGALKAAKPAKKVTVTAPKKSARPVAKKARRR